VPRPGIPPAPPSATLEKYITFFSAPCAVNASNRFNSPFRSGGNAVLGVASAVSGASSVTSSFYVTTCPHRRHDPGSWGNPPPLRSGFSSNSSRVAANVHLDYGMDRQIEPHAALEIRPSHGRGPEILTLGFATAVAMWAIGYVSRLPGISTPPALVFGLLVAALLAGGAAAARLSRRGWRSAAGVGVTAAALNLLVLMSVIGGKEGKTLVGSELLRVATVWIPSFLAISAALTAAGYTLGCALVRRIERDVNWTQAFAGVTLCATAMLLSVGGAVTGFQAGLAVPDWPNSFGYNMFLLPLSKMSGGVYFEHAHRLLGALVGLTTVTLAIIVTRYDARLGPRALAWLAVALVTVQGVLGGMRVTGRPTLSMEAADLAPSTLLAVVHGSTAQIFFALLAAIFAMSSRTWRTAPPAATHACAATDRVLGNVVVLALLLQLLLGALLRHYSWGLHLHLTLAAVVLVLIGFFSIRGWSLYDDVPMIGRLAVGLIWLTLAQLGLGVAALVAVMAEAQAGTTTSIHVLITTAHQTTGAIVLATALSLCIWMRRLTRPLRAPQRAAGVARVA
jgi:heme A synthase